MALSAALSEAHPAHLDAAVLGEVALHLLHPGPELRPAPLKPVVPVSPVFGT